MTMMVVSASEDDLLPTNFHFADYIAINAEEDENS